MKVAKNNICPPCSNMDIHLFSSGTFSGLLVGGKRTYKRFGKRIIRMIVNAGSENDMRSVFLLGERLNRNSTSYIFFYIFTLPEWL